MQEIKYIDINKLKSHPQNPRKIDERQFDVLCKSLQDNPDYFETRPILCNKDFVVFAGNMRLAAAKKLGLTEVPVSIMDISEERQREIMIRDNRENGTWDFEILGNLFELPELMNWGFSENELGGGIIPPEEQSDTCVRCAELKQMVVGHEHRSGHAVMEKSEEK